MGASWWSSPPVSPPKVGARCVLPFILIVLGDAPLVLKQAKDNPRLLNTDREVELLRPSTEGYKDLAVELTKVQISADLFIATSTYVDLASLAPLAKMSGGEVRYYAGFSRALHGEKLERELMHVISREQGWEAVMRIRVSKGWKITNFYGHQYVRLVLKCCTLS